MKAIGILLIIGGALFAFFAFGEFNRYNDLAGNPFRDLVANSAMYLAGISATAILSGIGFLIAGSKSKASAA